MGSTLYSLLMLSLACVSLGQVVEHHFGPSKDQLSKSKFSSVFLVCYLCVKC